MTQKPMQNEGGRQDSPKPFGEFSFAKRRLRVLELERRAMEAQRPGVLAEATRTKNTDPLARLQDHVDERVRMLVRELPVDNTRGFFPALAKREGQQEGHPESNTALQDRFLSKALQLGAIHDRQWVEPILSDSVTPVSLVEECAGPGEVADAVPLSPSVLHQEMDPADAARVWAGLRSGVRREVAKRRLRRWAVSAAAAVLLASVGIFAFGGTSREPEFVYRDVAQPPQGSWLAVAPVSALATPGPR